MIDFIIVGAGLYGAAFARAATDAGAKCLVLDRRSHVAGNAYTENVAGIDVHKYGAHIFHTNDEAVWHFVNRFATFNRYTNSPVANYKGTLYSLPFNMWTFNKMWGVTTPNEARAKIDEERQSAGITSPRNLEEQAISLVGTSIYETLVKGYTQKQWGRKCTDLPASIIKRLPVRYTFDNNYFDALHQGIPIGGYTAMVQGMLDGIKVCLGTDYLLDRENYESIAHKVIYTGQIDEYFDYCFGALEYRTLSFETQVLDTPNYQGNAVVNYTDVGTPYTRIVEHKHFITGLGSQGRSEAGEQEKTVITKEYPSEWKQGSEPYYPINDARNGTLYAAYKTLADGQDKVIFGGRLGTYRYLDMDKVIAEAQTAAARLCTHRHCDFCPQLSL